MQNTICRRKICISKSRGAKKLDSQEVWYVHTLFFLLECLSFILSHLSLNAKILTLRYSSVCVSPCRPFHLSRSCQASDTLTISMKCLMHNCWKLSLWWLTIGKYQTENGISYHGHKKFSKIGFELEAPTTLTSWLLLFLKYFQLKGILLKMNGVFLSQTWTVGES